MRNPEKKTLVCFCCHESYIRGKFRCCAPPSGINPHIWQGRWCKLCDKCPNHCACEARETREVQHRPLAALADTVFQKIQNGEL